MKTRRKGGPQVYQQVISFGPGHYFNFVLYIIKSIFRNLSLIFIWILI